jgi:hypothetical protein
MHYERGNAGVNVTLVVVILISLVVILSGYFKNDRVLWDTFNIKQLLRLPCGVTIDSPKSNTRATFPLTIGGYANGCGWIMDERYTSGNSVGTAQVFDDNGLPVTKPFDLVVSNPKSGYPLYFSNKLSLFSPPHTDTGKVLFISSTGLLYAVPVSF